ncbi:MAG: hypothetical protein JWR37_3525 [Mycobacterium sp.]|nr:hypothetical protein [Mycobacterium sp.]
MSEELRIVRTTSQNHRNPQNVHTGEPWPAGTYEVVFHLSRPVNDIEADHIKERFENIVKVSDDYMIQAGTNGEQVGKKQDWYQQTLAEIAATAKAHQEHMRNETESLKWDEAD